MRLLRIYIRIINEIIKNLYKNLYKNKKDKNEFVFLLKN